MGAAGVEAIAHALAVNKTLKTLDISEIHPYCYICVGDNDMGFDGAQHLAKGMHANTSLTSLSLRSRHTYSVRWEQDTRGRDCSSGGRDPGQPATTGSQYGYDRSRQEVGFNSIEKRGAELMANALIVNKKLRVLDLSSAPRFLQCG